MSRRGALAALLLLAAAPASAQPGIDDSDRIALIERVRASVVQVKSAPPPRPEPSQRRRDVDRSRDSKADDARDFFDRLTSQLGGPKPQEGSGFVVDSARGLVLTASHIVARTGGISVILPDGSERPAALAGIDEESGIALLKVGGAPLPQLELSPREARAGESALVAGWMIPLKSLLPLQGMVTGPAPGAVAGSESAPALVDYVALDLAIPNGGYGGAPVLDRSGKVIGMVSVIYGRGYGPGSLTLMIPAHQFAPLVPLLAAGGKIPRSRIGIDFDCSPGPCKVTLVEAGSPAAAGGVKEGDEIVAVDSSPIATDVELRRAIALRPVGSTVRLKVRRAGQELELQMRTDGDR